MEEKELREAENFLNCNYSEGCKGGIEEQLENNWIKDECLLRYQNH